MMMMIRQMSFNLKELLYNISVKIRKYLTKTIEC